MAFDMEAYEAIEAKIRAIWPTLVEDDLNSFHPSDTYQQFLLDLGSLVTLAGLHRSGELVKEGVQVGMTAQFCLTWDEEVEDFLSKTRSVLHIPI